jgi:hypothetical protein
LIHHHWRSFSDHSFLNVRAVLYLCIPQLSFSIPHFHSANMYNEKRWIRMRVHYNIRRNFHVISSINTYL